MKSPSQFATLVGVSPAIVAIRREIEKVADSNATVLITGPSGAGKDVAAQLLHQRSRRAGAPFVALNCAAVAPDLLESEMFGHEAGAFTGATRARAGRFEAAHGGTLFLDEVGDMSAAMQAKLLRTLETRIVERVGGMIPLAIDVRLIAATSVDLIAAIDRGAFRADLLYRLDVIRLEMPALADRPEDITPLIAHFNTLIPGPVLEFTPSALAELAAHSWPGNVRELRNIIERAKASHLTDPITFDMIPRLLRARPPRSAAPCSTSTPEPAPVLPDLKPGQSVDLRQLIADLEHAYIRAALEAAGGTIAGSARLLGLQRTTLIEKMRRLQITS
ncbi:MAG: sigma-54 interaction domain-containing protein [Polymorphobacter sp.]|uniref:sigma-54 interaction domain-containing protein n=1 Tax=Polymorphobacter sp. TaxID=1909290 RepID=UPI003A8B44A2